MNLIIALAVALAATATALYVHLDNRRLRRHQDAGDWFTVDNADLDGELDLVLEMLDI